MSFINILQHKIPFVTCTAQVPIGMVVSFYSKQVEKYSLRYIKGWREYKTWIINGGIDSDIQINKLLM
jgi:hypothetical protein